MTKLRLTSQQGTSEWGLNYIRICVSDNKSINQDGMVQDKDEISGEQIVSLLRTIADNLEANIRRSC